MWGLDSIECKFFLINRGRTILFKSIERRSVKEDGKIVFDNGFICNNWKLNFLI